MDLTVLDNNTHLRLYSEVDLNNILLYKFTPWLSKLLSLTDDISADRLEMALPAIKNACIGMGFNEIRKMFEMYVDGKLSVKPLTNFFDRILLGKIVDSYKTIKKLQKSTVMEVKVPEEEILRRENNALEKSELFFKKNRYSDSKYFYVFNILWKRNLIKLSEEEQESIKKDAIYILDKEYSAKKASSREDYKNIQNTISDIQKGVGVKLANKCKQLALEDYYRNKLK